jgi:hypothetical protein
MLELWTQKTDIVGCHQMFGFTPTASMAAIGEKLGMDPWIGQPVCCGSGWEPFFLGSSGSIQRY